MGQTTLLVFALLGGLCVGSFLNVVIHRLPRMMQAQWRDDCFLLEHPDQPLPERPAYNLALPRSACPHCGHAIRWYENIPVASWMALRGRCSGCRNRISARYPLVETATGLLTVLVAWHFGTGWYTLAALLLTWSLVALTLIDFDTQLLPDVITLPLLWLGLLVSLAEGGVSPEDAIIGAAAGYLTLWSVYQGFRLLTGKEGMGFGDFKLLGALGAWLGWQPLALVIVLSSGVGALLGIALILFVGRDRAQPMPFGPFLAIAGLIAFLWGEHLLDGPLRFFAFG